MTRISYETTECSRCGGSGHYSYNQRDGTKCWGCNTSGLMLTKAGLKAKGIMDAWKAEHLTIMAGDVEVGMVVNYAGHKPSTVTGIKAPGETPNGSMRNGETVMVPSMVIETRYMNYSLRPTDTISRRFTTEEFATMVALAETLPGAIVTKE